ncbi:helix-turn-helix transcriptional regulator [Parabacteroides sp. PF5-6]|uniref:helix-turn-helix domain-containing protein n=1 Tax=Parabacteroides sp. PF5-6 TaxID=1742403 RepID=UPI002406FB70|nr:helix-turn-helix transcriptional regulator [Parabacteroides sp. PF5-6]MDF9830440.1 AraC-like DNA-binding protein [Parabacteroides sp. PF5-6]
MQILQHLTLLFPPFACLFWVVTMWLDWKYLSRRQYLCTAVFIGIAAILFGWDHFFGYTLIVRYPVAVTIVMLLLTALLYIVGYRVSLSAYRQARADSETFPPAEEEEEEVEVEEEVEAEEEVDDLLEEEEEEDNHPNTYLKLLPEFNRLMDEEKLYLHPNLRIEEVAHLLNTNRTYVSRLLREEYNNGFFEYINLRRITYAQERMNTDPDLTQERLAIESGFVHASSFSRVFKQCTGMTFRQWQKTKR